MTEQNAGRPFKIRHTAQLSGLAVQRCGQLVSLAQDVTRDVPRLSEVELARVILALKATVRAAEVELGNHRDRARGDAALAQAAGELAPVSVPDAWPAADLRALVLTAGEIADAYGTGPDGLDGSDILSVRQRELMERAAQAFRAEGAEGS
jgi:myo-inositol catabolism protein IolC